MPTTLLDVHNVVVQLDLPNGISFNAVDDLSFTLEAGQTFCLVGESGCGKSLTALSVLGLLPAVGRVAAGEILFSGKNLVNCSEKEYNTIRGQEIGMIFQEPMTSLNPVLRVGDQVAEVLQHHKRMSYREALKKAIDLFDNVGIADPGTRIRDYPHQLSGGLRQRVMIAMALACDPKLLLADEPTTALDVTIQGQILALLRNLAIQNNMAMLLITHDLGVVAEVADHVGVMYAGRMVEHTSATALFKNPLHPYTQGLLRSAPTLEELLLEETTIKKRLETISGTVPTPQELIQKDILLSCHFRPRCPFADQRCIKRPPAFPREGGGTVCCWLYQS